MSSLRTRASEVRQRGIEQRGNFEPTGAPKRLYDYWLSNSRTNKAHKIRTGMRRENFCHFWRVVAFWAPFMWFRKKAASAIDAVGEYFLGALAVAAVGLFIWFIATSGAALEILAGMAIGVAGSALVGVGAFGAWFVTMDEDARHDHDGPSLRASKIMAAVGFPAAIPAFAVIYTARYLSKTLSDGQKIIGWLSVAVAAFVAATSLLGGWGGFIVSVSIVVLSAAIIGLGIVISVWVSDFVAGRRIKREEAEENFYKEHGHFPGYDTHGRRVAREPSRFEAWFGSFLSGIGDFIIFTAQVVRVNKWKICPTVEIKR